MAQVEARASGKEKLTMKPKFQMYQIPDIHPKKSGKNLVGAKGSDLMDCDEIAEKVWGDKASEPNSGIVAFSYLWRRFGPPWQGSDPHKDLSCYYLNTPDPDVFIWLSCSGSPLSYALGYLVDKKVDRLYNKPCIDWENKFNLWFLKNVLKKREFSKNEEEHKKESEIYWDYRFGKKEKEMKKAYDVLGDHPRMLGDKMSLPIKRRVEKAVTSALLELLRPVFIRDVPISIFGRLNDGDKNRDWEPAKPSPYAGYGMIKTKKYLDGYIKKEKK